MVARSSIEVSSRTMDQVKVVTIGVLVLAISLIGNAALGISLFIAHKKVQEVEQSVHVKTKVLDFANLFINKVLRAQGEISFEDRLKIENAVRDTQDKEIYDEWQKFIGVKTEEEGREEIKNLLQLIVNKIS